MVGCRGCTQPTSNLSDTASHALKSDLLEHHITTWGNALEQMRSQKESSIRKGWFPQCYEWRKLESGVCINLHYNKLIDGSGVDNTTYAECNTIIVPHLGTIEWSGSLLLKNVGEERRRKKKARVMRNGEQNGCL